jgi:hypothetical protein
LFGLNILIWALTSSMAGEGTGIKYSAVSGGGGLMKVLGVAFSDVFPWLN